MPTKYESNMLTEIQAFLHGGQDKLIKEIQRQVYIHNLPNKVDKIIKNCTICGIRSRKR